MFVRWKNTPSNPALLTHIAFTATNSVETPFVKEHLYDWPLVSFFSLWQKFCRDKHVFVETKHVFCHDKSMLAAIIIMFVMTKDVFCYDKTFVMTKMMLVAAPANHTPWGACRCESQQQL